MKISTSLEHAVRIAKVSYEDSAFMLKDAGFQGIDLSLHFLLMDTEKMLSPEWRRRVLMSAAAAKAAGLEIAQCHLPYHTNHKPYPGSGSYEDYEAYMMPQYRRALEVCGETGCPMAVLHPYANINDAADAHTGNVRLMEKLIPMLERYDVRLALENIWSQDYTWSHMSGADEINSVIVEAGSDRVGACIDTGHAHIFDLDICEMARIYGPRLFALHVNGNSGKDEHIIPYSMAGWCEQIDYHAFSDTLGKIGYNGFYNLELQVGALPPSAAQPYLNFAGAVARALADLAE